MSHELTQRKDGFVEMAYYGEEPWHGLGQRLTADAGIDEWIKQAGMDWQVKRSRVRYGEGDQQRIFDEHHVLFRSDTKEPLGIVSPKYKITHPGGCLEFFRDLLPAGFQLSAAGTLFGGRRYWATASIGAEAIILGNDKVSGYLLFVSSADGTSKTSARFTVTRAVCKNTIDMALSEKTKHMVAISHRTECNMDAMKNELGIARGAFGEFVEASRKLALITVNRKEAEQMTGALLVDSKTVTKEDVTTSAGYKSIMNLFQHGKGNHGETAWDWLNGVTEYVDHVQRAKSESHRMANSMFGKGDALKTMAMERALAIAD